MRVVFMGTPDFALHSLQALIKKHEVLAVITQPDRPRGRGQKLAAPPVKVAAVEAGLPCWQTNSIKDPQLITAVKELKPDVCVVVAFGQILPGELLRVPRYGCINVHASLLPRYRGAAPIHRAIVNGEQQTGVATMLMDEGLDTGDILLSREITIGEEVTAGQLHDRLAVLGAEVLLETLEKLAAGKITPQPQSEELACYAPPLDDKDEVLDWRRGTSSIVDQIRGLDPWPGAYTELAGKRLKIWRAQAYSSNGSPGEVLEVSDWAFVVATGDGAVQITELQPAGKKRMPAEAFLRGNKLSPGDKLG